MNEEPVSILIRTKNEERHIGQTLSVIFSQTYKNVEVLIVDSGSSDNTLEIAKKYPVSIYEIKPEDFTYGYSLNYGFEKANGKYVVCLSAHALPLSNVWLESLISNFHDENVGAVMCRNLPWPDCNPFDRRGLLKKFGTQKQEIRGGHPFIFGNYGSVIRRSVWEKIHFDETLSYAEDHDWALKMEKLGYKMIYEPGAEIYHSHNETLKQLLSRFSRESYALELLKLKEYSLLGILFDLIVGSVYDMMYVLIKRDNMKWFFFAPCRRFAMNYARFKAVRNVKRSRP